MQTSLNNFYLSAKTNDHGFSLIELMITVAIVGILSSIAVPNFNRMKYNAYNSQAKSTLGQIYTLERIFNDEFLTYTTRLDAMGFSSAGDMYFDTGFKTDFSGPSTVPQGSDECINTCEGAICPNTTWTCRETSMHGLSFPFNSYASATRFQAEAHAHLPESFSADPDENAVTFAINERKELWSVVPAD